MSTIATLSTLNANDNAAELGGILLGDDGVCQLWLFGDKVADRRYSFFGQPERRAEWSDDVAGWNYDPETDCIPA